MSYQPKNLLKLWVMIFTAVVLAGPALAAAPRKSPGGVTGGARLRPSSSWTHQRAARSVRHARDYSRDIYRYSRNAGHINPAVAKAESEELGHNITKAQQHLATARKEAGNDPDTVAALESIEKHLSSAAEQHKALHEECCKPSVDGAVSMSCCSSITLDLEKAQAEHNALLRSLEIKSKKTKKSK